MGPHTIRVCIDQELAQNAHGQGMRNLRTGSPYAEQSVLVDGKILDSQHQAMMGDFPIALWS